MKYNDVKNNNYKTDVSIIIIHYNNFEQTKIAIDTLKRFTTDLKYEIIVIDNNSLDGSGALIKKEFGEQITYLQAEDNLGTTKAFNRARKEANGKYVLWLNPDIVFVENFIKKLYDFMEAHPDCGVCGGNMVGKDGKPTHSYDTYKMTVKSLRSLNCLSLFAIKKIFKKVLSLNYNYGKKPKKVATIVGADMFIRSEVFDKIGDFEEDIFMYAEETEFQFRLSKLTNYKIYSVPNTKLIHLEGASFAEREFSEKRFTMTMEGTFIYLKKWFGEREALRYLKAMKKDYGRLSLLLFPFKKRRKLYLMRKAVAEKLISKMNSDKSVK